jgi:predicted small integral membrane protein
MLRMTKVLMVVCVTLWCLLGAAEHILDWGGTMGAVGSAASMSTFDGGAESWKATSNPIVIWMGALMIMLSKLAAGILCSMGALKMWRARASESAVFSAAKSSALAGCAIAMIMLFGGFIVIGETWFEMWRSDVLRDLSLQSAFRYGGMITLIALFVASRDD